MNIRDLEQRLRDKEQELLRDMTRTEVEARESRASEVNDASVSSESKESWLRETTSDWSIFAQVRDALRRIETGTYGKCIDCGRQIQSERLESIPWTPYCIKHEKRHEREAASSQP